jgi:predicted flap endonuclease-1-like 5' DNA nuclease
MSGLGCCLWWFLLGALLGWLASWLLGRMLGSGTTTVSTPMPAADVAPRAAARVPSDGIDHAAARASGFLVSSADNLEIIEGIGPSIANHLRRNGVTSFARLAAMTVAEITAILELGGPRYRIANPETWAEQAGLAAGNNWAELRALQDRLDAGVRRID